MMHKRRADVVGGTLLKNKGGRIRGQAGAQGIDLRPFRAKFRRGAHESLHQGSVLGRRSLCLRGDQRRFDIGQQGDSRLWVVSHRQTEPTETRRVVPLKQHFQREA